MKTTIYLLVLLALTVILLYQFDLSTLELIPIENIDLSTLLLSFPIVLALTERFNELFVVKKKDNTGIERDNEVAISKSNFRLATQVSFAIGLLLSIVGFRILGTFMNLPSEAHMIQDMAFRSVDCILTATVIAGGTDGWHQLVGLLSDITKAKRKETKEEIA